MDFYFTADTFGTFTNAAPPSRPVHGECPYCGAGHDEWCREDCGTVDPLDHR